ncbi:hypothetical protein GGR51DRAFT_19032 [Nemania sp. FL0031]|nr:hypothetical protein GGR51DRAFT_19032 [Nemania sp. FL0031]
MFVTLRCSKDGLFVRDAPTVPEDGNKPRHIACFNCRLRKLKCSGDRKACSACISSKTRCTYPSETSQKIKTRRDSHKTLCRLSKSPSEVLSITTEASPTGAPWSPEESRQQPTPDCAPSPTLLPYFLAHQELAPDAYQTSCFDGQPTMLNWSPELLPLMNGEFSGSADVLTDDISWYSSLPKQDGNPGSSISGSSKLVRVPLDPSPAVSSSTEQVNAYETDENNDPNASSELTIRPTPPNPKPSDSSEQRSDSSIDVADKPGCTCLTNVVAILEKLEIYSTQGGQISFSRMGDTLSLSKNAMARCNRMLDCTTCRSSSSAIMILLLIGRHLVSQFDQLSECSFSRDVSLDTPLDTSQATQREPGMEKNTWLGDYSVDTPEEWKEMLLALANIQIKSLGSFLRRMRAAVSCTNWTTHQTILGRIDSQYLNVVECTARGG